MSPPVEEGPRDSEAVHLNSNGDIREDLENGNVAKTQGPQLSWWQRFRRWLVNGGRWGHCKIGCPVVFFFCLLFIISIVAIIYLAAGKNSQPQILCPSAAPSSTPDWIRNGTKEYHFSETQETWNNSLSTCTSFGGSLVTLDTEEEMDFVKHFRSPTEYWLGLWREDAAHPWKMPNGSLFNDRFKIRGDGSCAYMNENHFSSTLCSNVRRWICRRPIRTA